MMVAARKLAPIETFLPLARPADGARPGVQPELEISGIQAKLYISNYSMNTECTKSLK